MSVRTKEHPKKVSADPYRRGGAVVKPVSAFIQEKERRDYIFRMKQDERLRHLTGFARAMQMIAERKQEIEPEFTVDGWESELKKQELQAKYLLAEHSFDEDFPDFESELANGRVVFSIDEVMCAALAFEAQGRATPAPVGAVS